MGQNIYSSQDLDHQTTDLVGMVKKFEMQCLYSDIAASGLVKTGAGRFFGFMVNSNSSGTVKVWDNTAGSGTVIFNTITLPAGSTAIFVLPVAVRFTTGLYITIGGTADITVLYN